MTVEVRGTGGPADAESRLLVIYTGGTIGMAARPDGALAPLDVSEIATYSRQPEASPVGLTLASFTEPIDSSTMRPSHWIEIADAITDLADGHDGVVVLHGTDTMAFTASALSFLLEGIDRPIVLTGAQRPITELRTDAERNLASSAAIAAMRSPDGTPEVPEVALFFDDALLRGNRTTKVHADSFDGFASPNLGPLARTGVTIEIDRSLVRKASAGPIRRAGGLCEDVAALRLHPALDRAGLAAVLDRPGLRGMVLEAYGAGNGPTEPWFLDRLRQAIDAGIVVVVTTQTGAGVVRPGHYATGAALFETGAVPGHDLTFEAALTKLMALLDRHDADETRRLMETDLAGELTLG